MYVRVRLNVFSCALVLCTDLCCQHESTWKRSPPSPSVAKVADTTRELHAFHLSLASSPPLRSSLCCRSFATLYHVMLGPVLGLQKDLCFPTTSLIFSMLWSVLHSAPHITAASRHFLWCDCLIIAKSIQCHLLYLGCCHVLLCISFFWNHVLHTVASLIVRKANSSLPASFSSP